jgi:predicted neuraminidase
MNARTAVPENGVFVSTDRGRTWDCRGGIHIPSGRWVWAENNVVELEDGTIVMLIRSNDGYLYRSDSTDGGCTWGQPFLSDIPNPSSKIRLLKGEDGRIFLLHNPSSKTGMDGRYPLSLWISSDDLKTWSEKRDIIIFPGRHSYPDGFLDEDEGFIHFCYDYNKHDVIYIGVPI